MARSKNYRLGLTYLIYLIISADKIIEDSELEAMKGILHHEGMEDDDFESFINEVRTKKERELYEKGIDLVSSCTMEERKRAFAWLYKMSEVDGHVHVKEVRFLLYSVKHAGIEFEDVVSESASLPAI